MYSPEILKVVTIGCKNIFKLRKYKGYNTVDNGEFFSHVYQTKSSKTLYKIVDLVLHLLSCDNITLTIWVSCMHLEI